MDEGINSMVETIHQLEAENEKLKFRLSNVSCQREQLIAFLRQQSKLHYITIYENDFDFADKLLKAINCS
jgi:regulator of replication initiation timing